MKGKVKCKKCGSSNLTMKVTTSYEEHFGVNYRTGEFSEEPFKTINDAVASYKCWECGSTSKGVVHGKHR